MIWRRRLALGAVVLLGGIAALLLVRSLDRDSTATSVQAAHPTPTTVRLSAKVMKQRLPAAISGESAVDVRGSLRIVGGLDSSGVSATGTYSLDPRTGDLRPSGTLAQPLHDAAAAPGPSGMLVFGGGSTTSTDAVEALGNGGSARIVGTLPKPRSDLAAATAGNDTYLLGGYDGNALDPSVLATRDGRSFRKVATLPVPVRYPATAAAGNAVYVFGGETATGRPTDAIQQVLPGNGAARVIGHLPHPIDHASAISLGGRIYVLGGTVGGTATDRVVSFDPSTRSTRPAGPLPEPVTNAGAATIGGTGYLIGGLGRNGQALDSVVRLTLTAVPVRPSRDTASTGQSTTAGSKAGGPPPAFRGHLLIADRGNDRLLLVNARKRVLWRYPAPGRPAPPGGFYFPDDAFFIRGGHGIISNEEQDERIVEIGFPSGKVQWSYGHQGVIGSSPGYLHEPDDAYLLKDGTVTVADAQNCRVLSIRPHDHVSQIGTPGECVHNPPKTLGSPNGDTPLRNGDLLVSEVNGSYIDEFKPDGRLVWSAHLPIAYPSDPQQLGPGRYLVADYSSPGGIYEFDRSGRILWSYRPSSGPGMLDHPSLAEQLPDGLIATNDDYRDRVVLINPLTKRIVWQYGRTDTPGTGPGMLNTPDGFDLLSPSGTTPTHPFTG